MGKSGCACGAQLVAYGAISEKPLTPGSDESEEFRRATEKGGEKGSLRNDLD